MKFRRHHNNNARRSIQTGSVEKDVRRIAEKLKIPYGDKSKPKQLGTVPDN